MSRYCQTCITEDVPHTFQITNEADRLGAAAVKVLLTGVIHALRK